MKKYRKRRTKRRFRRKRRFSRKRVKKYDTSHGVIMKCYRTYTQDASGVALFTVGWGLADAPPGFGNTANLQDCQEYARLWAYWD